MGLFRFSKNYKKGISDTPSVSPYDISGFWRRIQEYPGYAHATPKTKREFLQFVLEVVKMDLQGSTLSRMFFQENVHINPEVFPIPAACKPEKQTHEIRFEGNTVICVPYDFTKLIGAVEDINREGFKRGPDCHYTGFYYPEIKLLMVQNGQHHSAVASIRGGGSVTAWVYHLPEAFDRLSLSDDYRFWMLDGEPKFSVVDPRFALIYELGRELFLLRKNENQR